MGARMDGNAANDNMTVIHQILLGLNALYVLDFDRDVYPFD
jgi:hypothetical protein